MRLHTPLITVSIVAAYVGIDVSHAQQVDYYSRDKYESVLDRKQPEFDPEPVRVGSLLVSSRAEAAISSTDNVFAAEANEESDILVRVGAAASALSDWSNNQIGIEVSAYRNEYLDFSNESNDNLEGQLRGRLDVTRELAISGRAFVEDRAEQRTDLTGSLGVDRPVQLTRSGAALRANYKNDRIQLNGGVTIINRDFDDARSIVDGSNVDQDFRDREEVSLDARTSYAISPDVAFFAQARSYDTSFDNRSLIGGALRTRDNDGYTVQVGANFELQSLISGDVAVGYLEEDKKDAAFGDVDGLSIEGNLSWYPSRLTTISANAGRRAADIGILEAPSGTQTNFGLNVAHEFRRNVIGQVFFDQTQFETEDIDRDDEINQIGASATYKLNKRAHLQAYVRYIDREISGLDNTGSTGYENSVAGIGISLFP
jgi:hypothetical protein